MTIHLIRSRSVHNTGIRAFPFFLLLDLMTTKRITILFFILLPPMLLLSQGAVRYDVFEASEGVFKIKVSEGLNFQRDYEVQGSPYLAMEFTEAKWVVKGQFEKKVKMRYDAYRDNIQLIQNGKQIFLVKDKDVEATIDGKRYQYLNYLDHDNLKSGYMNPLNNGKTMLYAKTLKIVKPPIFPLHGYESITPATFGTKIIHYIQRAGKMPTPLQDLSRKEVFAVLWDKYSALKKYARHNKLHLRTEAEVIRILEYYEESVD